MADEKDYEIPKHRKKSLSANRSVSARGVYEEIKI